MAKANHDEAVVHFQDALHGPPTSWVPPRVSPSPIPPSNDNKPPTSLWKGEGRLRPRLACEVAGVLFAEPTSLNRGEGLVSGRSRMVGGELVVARVKAMVEEGERMSKHQP
jgi:hypothetical protein